MSIPLDANYNYAENETCIFDFSACVKVNKLKLISDKTALIAIGTKIPFN